MQIKFKIAIFAIFYSVLTNSAFCADDNLKIDLDMSKDYQKINVTEKLQDKLEVFDKNRKVRSLGSDEWLRFHNKEGFEKHVPGNLGNRAMADEIKNSSKYKGSNLDPLSSGDGSLDNFGFTGKIDLN